MNEMAPPRSVTIPLRIEALAFGVAAVVAYAYVSGNWWMFALLILVPDLSFLGSTMGQKIGSEVYNLAHNAVWSVLLGALGFLTGISWMLPVALIWLAHIGFDRALGYGLKYPGTFGMTHLGRIGKDRTAHADAG